jgi:tetratricopeptide (TPR) repeat protein
MRERKQRSRLLPLTSTLSLLLCCQAYELLSISSKSPTRAFLSHRNSGATSVLPRHQDKISLGVPNKEKQTSPGAVVLGFSIDDDDVNLTTNQRNIQQRRTRQSGSAQDQQQRLLKYNRKWKYGNPFATSTSQGKENIHKQASHVDLDTWNTPTEEKLPLEQTNGDNNLQSIPNSLEEWSRNKVTPLLNRRQAIRREQSEGKRNLVQANNPVISKEDYIESLRKTLNATSTHSSGQQQQEVSSNNNRQLHVLYQQMKAADKQGNVQQTYQLLTLLRKVAPHDGRVVRRLARWYAEQDQLEDAIGVLQNALQEPEHCENAFLWHGIGQYLQEQFQQQKDGDANSNEDILRNVTYYYRQAIQCDPSLPHPYHALALCQHSYGHIAAAMKTLQEGLSYCPQNHRLHHALGDVYRQAASLERAAQCYSKALQWSPDHSKGYAFTALARVHYELDQPDKCRHYLQKALQQNPKQVSAWVAWAQMEESLRDVDAARNICRKGAEFYEQGYLTAGWNKVGAVHRSNDPFHQLYRTWSRLEERYGTPQVAWRVHERALSLFPRNVNLYLDAASYKYEKRHNLAAARAILTRCLSLQHSTETFASSKVLLAAAKLELEVGDATGALQWLSCQDGKKRRSAAWWHMNGVAHWHLNNLREARESFEQALLNAKDDKSLTADIYSTKARFEYAQGDCILAQHYVCLSLAHNKNCKTAWELWYHLSFGDYEMQHKCWKQFQQDDLQSMKKHMMRKDPWHTVLFGLTPKTTHLPLPIRLPPIIEPRPSQPKMPESPSDHQASSSTKQPRKFDTIEM